MCFIHESYETEYAELCVYLDVCVHTPYWGGRDPYFTGGVRRRCHIHYIRRKGPVLHGRSAKTVPYVSNWEEGTRIARAEYEDGAMICLYLYLTMTENNGYTWCICVCDCVTLMVCWCVIVCGSGDIWYWSCGHLSRIAGSKYTIMKNYSLSHTSCATFILFSCIMNTIHH